MDHNFESRKGHGQERNAEKHVYSESEGHGSRNEELQGEDSDEEHEDNCEIRMKTDRV